MPQNRKRSSCDLLLFCADRLFILVQPLADEMANDTCYDRGYERYYYLHRIHLLPVGPEVSRLRYYTISCKKINRLGVLPSKYHTKPCKIPQNIL